MRVDRFRYGMFDQEPFHNNPTLTRCINCKSKEICDAKGKCLLKAARTFGERYQKLLILFSESPAGNTSGRYKIDPETGERVLVVRPTNTNIVKKQRDWPTRIAELPKKVLDKVKSPPAPTEAQQIASLSKVERDKLAADLHQNTQVPDSPDPVGKVRQTPFGKEQGKTRPGAGRQPPVKIPKQMPTGERLDNLITRITENSNMNRRRAIGWLRKMVLRRGG